MTKTLMKLTLFCARWLHKKVANKYRIAEWFASFFCTLWWDFLLLLVINCINATLKTIRVDSEVIASMQISAFDKSLGSRCFVSRKEISSRRYRHRAHVITHNDLLVHTKDTHRRRRRFLPSVNYRGKKKPKIIYLFINSRFAFAHCADVWWGWCAFCEISFDSQLMDYWIDGTEDRMGCDLSFGVAFF